MTDVRLVAGVGPPEALAAGLSCNGAAVAPAILVSYVYLGNFMAHRHRYSFRDWALDSGAFSAHNSGRPIELSAYIAKCRELIETDNKLVEVYSLDVIGNWRASMRNCEAMWGAGVSAIPTYHYGEPWSVLTDLAKKYPKVALGGVAKMRGNRKNDWAGQCFARVWPKALHGFGFGSEASIMAYPWHSVDATNWEIGPCAFGRWNSYGKMSVRGGKQNLRVEVEWYLRLERRARARWARELAQLPNCPTAQPPDVRLVVAGRQPTGKKAGKPGTIRLAAQQGSEAQIARSGMT